MLPMLRGHLHAPQMRGRLRDAAQREVHAPPAIVRTRAQLIAPPRHPQHHPRGAAAGEEPRGAGLEAGHWGQRGRGEVG